MPTLELVPRSWLSWDFKLLDNGNLVAQILMSTWGGEKANLIVEGAEYQVSKEHILRGTFLLQKNGELVAKAEKRSAFRSVFQIEQAGRQFTLEKQSVFGRSFVLKEMDREVGHMSPKGVFTRKSEVVLPEGLPAPLEAFIVWLVLVLWRRKQNAEATTVAVGT